MGIALLMKCPWSAGQQPRLHRLREQLVEGLAIETARLVDEGAVAKDRRRVLRGRLLVAVEEADGQPRIELHRLRQRGHEVRRIVARGLLELVDPLLEPGIRVDLVERDAGAADVEEREALVLDGGGGELREVLLLAREAARHVGGAGDEGESERLDRLL